MPFQNGLKRCVFSKSFFWNSSLVIDYRFLVIDYTVIFWRVMTFEFEFKSFIASNRLQHLVIDYRFKIQIQNPFLQVFFKLSSGNPLHFLVIDYQSLGCLGNTLFWGKAWSLVNLEARLCLLKQPCINLEAMLILWSNLVWFFFGIIKIMYSYIHILPLFDDDNHYQVISFRHHQNMHDSQSKGSLSSSKFKGPERRRKKGKQGQNASELHP